MEGCDAQQVSVLAVGALSAGSLCWGKALGPFLLQGVEWGLGHCCAWCSLGINHVREGGMEAF